MKATKLIIAAGIALAASAAFAETGVGTLQIDNVTNAYGRAGVPNVKISGKVHSAASDVTTTGRSAGAIINRTTVGTDADANANDLGRS